MSTPRDPDDVFGCARTHRTGSMRKRYCGGKAKNGEHVFVLLPECTRFFREWTDLPKSSQDRYGNAEAWAEDVKRREAEREANPGRLKFHYREIECQKCGRREFVNKDKAANYPAQEA